MHISPILLVKADSLEDAKELAEDFCYNQCGENSYFDYGGIVPDTETEFNKPLIEVKSKLPKFNYVKEAELLVLKAQEYLLKKNDAMAGLYFRKAGELYGQHFSTECTVYNIKYNNYSQDYGKGWYAIETDFHC